MKLDEFAKKLNKKKPYRNLPDIYKTDKFLRLYYKIYEYILSIPKEEIVYTRLKVNIFGNGLVHYIEYFLKAKDFNNWRYRVHELMTKKINNMTIDKWKLLYNSKAEEFWNEFKINRQKANEEQVYNRYGVKNVFQLEEVKEKNKESSLKNWGTENPSQSEEIKEKKKQISLKNWSTECPFQNEEVKEKSRKRNLERHGKEYYTQTDEYIKKAKEANRKRRGVDWPMQSKEVQEKSKSTSLKNWGTEYASQSEEWQNRRRQNMMEKHGRPNIGGWLDINGHSKIADDFCTSLYNMIPNMNCIFYEKDNKEYSIENRLYDFCIPDLKIIIEFDGIYWHGLMEGQKDVKGKPVEEVWKDDLEKTKLAEDMGFRVIRVREDEYKENKDLVLNRIYKLIFSRWASRTA